MTTDSRLAYITSALSIILVLLICPVIARPISARLPDDFHLHRPHHVDGGYHGDRQHRSPLPTCKLIGGQAF
jgi:hypothetical protein